MYIYIYIYIKYCSICYFLWTVSIYFNSFSLKNDEKVNVINLLKKQIKEYIELNAMSRTFKNPKISYPFNNDTIFKEEDELVRV